MKALAALWVAVTAYAQAPVHLAFQCTDDDLQVIGQSCSATEPCPVYLELSSLEIVGPKVFLTGNLHSDTSTISSILLASPDGGRTWTEPHERIRSAILDQIQFIDFEVGWIAGGIVARTPRDPFLLLTNDGGKTWRQRPIFEESRTGAVEQFWFDSRTAGALVVDLIQASDTGARHERYETMTGGESWMIRETGAAPIRLKGRPLPNPSWRLRADAPSKSFRLEREETGRWLGVATFPVKIGECKPAERTLAEPQPEPDAGKAEPEPPETSEKPPVPAKPPSLRKKKPFSMQAAPVTPPAR